MFSLGACPRRGGIYFHVGIYFPARHALLFAMVKKNPGPSMFSPGACTRRVGIYFPGGHVLLFGIIKKIPGPSMFSPGACPRGIGFGMYTTTTYESLRLLLLLVECVLLLYRHSIRTRPGPLRAGTVPARGRTRTRPGPDPDGTSPGTWSGTKFQDFFLS